MRASAARRTAAGQQPDAGQLDVSEQARLFLSCVSATGQMFGAGHIIDILRGSQNQRVLQRKHDRLPTHGAGQETRVRDWRRLATEFISQGLREQDMEHGSLRITARGQAVLDGGQVFVAPEAVLYLLGTQMDFETTSLRTGFTFNNPNQTSACGCGESVELTPASASALG